MTFSVDMDGFDTDKILESLGMQPGGPVQEALDRAVVEYAKPYWAWDTGRLANSANGSIGTGELVYDVDYAWEMYYGVRADGSPVNYHLDKNPQAGAYPIERMWADHMEDIIREVNLVAEQQR